jgi:hypothetical protein
LPIHAGTAPGPGSPAVCLLCRRAPGLFHWMIVRFGASQLPGRVRLINSRSSVRLFVPYPLTGTIARQARSRPSRRASPRRPNHARRQAQATTFSEPVQTPMVCRASFAPISEAIRTWWRWRSERSLSARCCPRNQFEEIDVQTVCIGRPRALDNRARISTTWWF